MCGFVGFSGDYEEKEQIIKKMTDSIAHRGPDSFGEYSDDFIAIGFRRLSIIDLNNGDQPMFNEDESVITVFNGEIYNYLELRAMLEEKGHVFRSSSDSETLVHLYEEFGHDMLNYLRGMFSFAIYDKNNRELFCARDYFGIKPFYYGLLGDRDIIFGSEIKSFLNHPNFEKVFNNDALENYLTFQYSVLRETFFKGVFKLMPAHYLVFREGDIIIERYWSPEFKPTERLLSEAITEIDNVIQDSIQAHMISDVEVGSFLSSGVDSSYIAACFNGGKTFTVGFDYEKYNEIEYAKTLSEFAGIQNYSKMITTQEYWDILPTVQYQMDEPLADPSAIALYFVSQLASEHVKVVLSGEGADEFFGGYNIYREPLDLKIMTDLPMFIRKFFAKLVKLIPFSFKGKNFFIRASKSVEERFIGNANIFSVAERERILKNPKGTPPLEITGPYYEKIRDYDDVTKMQYIDIHLWMVGDILLKADKMSMSHSLEVRVPYLDKEVFKIASGLQTDYRVNRQATKYAFRMAAKSHIPVEVADKKKLGFPVPIRIWLRDDKYYGLIRQSFLSPVCEKYFNTDKLLEILEEHKAGKRDNSRKIWTVYMFLVWYEQYFTDTDADADTNTLENEVS